MATPTGCFLEPLIGRTISKISMAYLDPRGCCPVSIYVECSDGSAFSVITDRAIKMKISTVENLTFVPLSAPQE